MSLKLMEAAVAALSTYFQANMPAKLTALNAEYADFTLDSVKKWYEGNLSAAVPEYPSLCFEAVAVDPEERTSTKLYLKNYLNIHIFVGDDNDQTRFKRLARYARAAEELLNAGQSSYGYAFAHEGKWIWTNSFKADAFIQGVTLPISLYPLDGETY